MRDVTQSDGATESTGGGGRRLLGRAGCLLAIAALAGVAWLVHDWNHRLTCEYAAAGVTREITDYVKAHEGRWPTSWQDLGDRELVDGLVRVRFDLTADQILQDRTLLDRAILPVSGPYMTYPHAMPDRDELWKALSAARPAPATAR